MRTNTKKVLGAVAVAGLVATGGSAFTAGGTLPAATGVKSYANQTITGATAKSVAYNANAIGDTYESVSLVLNGDTLALTIKIAFNDASPAACSGAGTVTTDANGVKTTGYTCVVSQLVNTATEFAVVAS